MTALDQYDRLEAAALWRAAPEAQRRDVIVSLGDATLTITDLNDTPLAHWSLAAVERANPGELPALYHPDGDPGESLEFPPDEEEMITAIERVRQAIQRRRPRPGRLRLVSGLSITAALTGLAVFWLPGTILSHTLTVVPAVKRAEIGAALLSRIERVAGAPCEDPAGRNALNRLGARLLDGPAARRLVVLRDGLKGAAHLPGGHILLSRAVVEDFEEPDVAAGYVLAEALRAAREDPLERLLREGGLMASFRLLTTGQLPDEVLDHHAETLMTAPAIALTDEALLSAFAEARVRAAPYAYALDVTGETTLGLIEADPFATTPPRPVLTDADWLRLQGICGS